MRTNEEVPAPRSHIQASEGQAFRTQLLKNTRFQTGSNFSHTCPSHLATESIPVRMLTAWCPLCVLPGGSVPCRGHQETGPTALSCSLTQPPTFVPAVRKRQYCHKWEEGQLSQLMRGGCRTTEGPFRPRTLPEDRTPVGFCVLVWYLIKHPVPTGGCTTEL